VDKACIGIDEEEIIFLNALRGIFLSAGIDKEAIVELVVIQLYEGMPY